MARVTAPKQLAGWTKSEIKNYLIECLGLWDEDLVDEIATMWRADVVYQNKLKTEIRRLNRKIETLKNKKKEHSCNK